MVDTVCAEFVYRSFRGALSVSGLFSVMRATAASTL